MDGPVFCWQVLPYDGVLNFEPSTGVVHAMLRLSYGTMSIVSSVEVCLFQFFRVFHVVEPLRSACVGWVSVFSW